MDYLSALEWGEEKCPVLPFDPTPHAEYPGPCEAVVATTWPRENREAMIKSREVAARRRYGSDNSRVRESQNYDKVSRSYSPAKVW